MFPTSRLTFAQHRLNEALGDRGPEQGVAIQGQRTGGPGTGLNPASGLVRLLLASNTQAAQPTGLQHATGAPATGLSHNPSAPDATGLSHNPNAPYASGQPGSNIAIQGQHGAPGTELQHAAGAPTGLAGYSSSSYGMPPQSSPYSTGLSHNPYATMPGAGLQGPSGHVGTMSVSGSPGRYGYGGGMNTTIQGVRGGAAPTGGLVNAATGQRPGQPQGAAVPQTGLSRAQ